MAHFLILPNEVEAKLLNSSVVTVTEHLYTVVFIEEVWGRGALNLAQHSEIWQFLFSRFVINCPPLHCGFYIGGLEGGRGLNLAQNSEISSETQLLFSRFVINCTP